MLGLLERFRLTSSRFSKYSPSMILMATLGRVVVHPWTQERQFTNTFHFLDSPVFSEFPATKPNTMGSPTPVCNGTAPSPGKLDRVQKTGLRKQSPRNPRSMSFLNSRTDPPLLLPTTPADRNLKKSSAPVPKTATPLSFSVHSSRFLSDRRVPRTAWISFSARFRSWRAARSEPSKLPSPVSAAFNASRI